MIDKENMEDGWYYSQEKHGVEICHWDSDHEMWDTVFGSEKVLAPVPSYEEWMFQKNELAAANGLLKYVREQNTQLKEEVKNCKFILKSRESEIVKLKKLLERCKKHLNASFPEIYRELLTEINEVME